MTLLAHWVLDDTNLGAKTCASRGGPSRTLSLSNVSTITKRDTYLPDARDSLTTRNVLNFASLSSGGGNGNFCTCNNQSGLFTSNGTIVFDILLRLANGVSFILQLIDSNDVTNTYQWTVSIADGAITILPQQFVGGSSSDSKTHVLRFVDLGVAKAGDLSLLTIELDADADFATPRFTSYLNGEYIRRTSSTQAAASTYTSGNVDVRIKNHDTATLNFLCEFMLTDTAATLADVRTRARFARWFRGFNPMPALDRLESTTLQLFGNDYVEGAASWFDRSLSGNDAVAVGAANLTTSYSSRFLGRQAVKGAASSGFYAAGDVVTGATERTYEIVLEDFGAQAVEVVLSRQSDSATQHCFWLQKNSNTGLVGAIWPSTGFGSGSSYMGGGYFENVGGFPGTSPYWNLPTLFHVVVDVPNRSIDIWRNGEMLLQTSNPMVGSLGSLATPNVGILGKFNTTSNTFDSGEYFTGRLLELARHEELFTPAMIAARCAVFNELRGY